MHGVFPSDRGNPASSRGIRFPLSLRWRQRGSRYAIRAGRNLPDKEFRYLRTVIVTAAVYWGFNSVLAHLLLTFQHRAGVRPYTSPCGFAEPCVFSKQSPPPGLCPRNVTIPGLLLPKLRRHFAEFLQRSSLKRLGILYLSTCVGLGYGLMEGYFQGLLPERPNPIRNVRSHNPSHPPGPGILTWFPSTTPFGLALGAGLPCSDLALSRNPWTSGERVSHPLYRYSRQHSR